MFRRFIKWLDISSSEKFALYIAIALVWLGFLVLFMSVAPALAYRMDVKWSDVQKSDFERYQKEHWESMEGQFNGFCTESIRILEVDLKNPEKFNLVVACLDSFGADDTPVRR